ncbi:MAG: hypothetical protein H2076_00420 [Planctomycetes bacterium]|nr:hypothetical protein [Planctomycetota bacterium]
MSPEPTLTPLPKASARARSMVRKQILRSLGYSIWQGIRFPLFLFTRYGFRDRIRQLVQRPQKHTPAKNS